MGVDYLSQGWSWDSRSVVHRKVNRRRTFRKSQVLSLQGRGGTGKERKAKDSEEHQSWRQWSLQHTQSQMLTLASVTALQTCRLQQKKNNLQHWFDDLLIKHWQHEFWLFRILVLICESWFCFLKLIQLKVFTSCFNSSAVGRNNLRWGRKDLKC